MKAFPSNVSVTIINRRQYDKSLPNDLNKVNIAWKKRFRREVFHHL